MNTVLIILGIIYLVVLIPALRTAIAFWLHKDEDAVAYMAMQNGFISGFISIWVIYPWYVVKDVINSIKDGLK